MAAKVKKFSSRLRYFKWDKVLSMMRLRGGFYDYENVQELKDTADELYELAREAGNDGSSNYQTGGLMVSTYVDEEDSRHFELFFVGEQDEAEL